MRNLCFIEYYKAHSYTSWHTHYRKWKYAAIILLQKKAVTVSWRFWPVFTGGKATRIKWGASKCDRAKSCKISEGKTQRQVESESESLDNWGNWGPLITRWVAELRSQSSLLTSRFCCFQHASCHLDSSIFPRGLGNGKRAQIHDFIFLLPKSQTFSYLIIRVLNIWVNSPL